MSIGQDSATGRISRREALRIGLATASLLFVSACQSFTAFPRRRSDFDSASADLNEKLDEVATDEVERARLASIARRLEAKARELITDYEEFQANLDALSIERQISSADLRRLGQEFEVRRIALRNDLLWLQDELRAELTEAEWDRVVTALNRKAEDVGRSSEISGG
jgi:hypothetical protein